MGSLCGECNKSYYGTGIQNIINVKASAQYYNNSIDGGKLWILKINSSTAEGLQFYFNKFVIPERSSLFIYNDDKSIILGPYTSYNTPLDTNKLIQFGTAPLPGKTVYIEYFQSDSASSEGNISICNTIHAFTKDAFFNKTSASSLSCEKDVSCPEGVGWEKEINSVGLIVYFDSQFNLAGHCSGALINNTASDGKPYFLTAAHCAKYDPNNINAYDYTTWQFVLIIMHKLVMI